MSDKEIKERFNNFFDLHLNGDYEKFMISLDGIRDDIEDMSRKDIRLLTLKLRKQINEAG